MSDIFSIVTSYYSCPSGREDGNGSDLTQTRLHPPEEGPEEGPEECDEVGSRITVFFHKPLAFNEAASTRVVG